jgi:hypothetical protein
MFVRHDSIQELPGAPQDAPFPTAPSRVACLPEYLFKAPGYEAGQVWYITNLLWTKEYSIQVSGTLKIQAENVIKTWF